MQTIAMNKLFAAGPAAAGRYGIVERALIKLWAKPATIVDVQEPADRFRLVTLQSDALRGMPWQPGQTIRLQLAGFAPRTYTPLSWDSGLGVVRILTYLHYQLFPATPGTSWAATVKTNDTCMLFVPRLSLDLSNLQRPVVFFGDETSIALAHAFRATRQGLRGISTVLEATSIGNTGKVLGALDLHDVTLVERTRDNAHLAQVENELHRVIQAQSPKQFLISGKAGSIRRLTRSLEGNGAAPSQFYVKPYWELGKKGLE